MAEKTAHVAHAALPYSKVNKGNIASRVSATI